jgi:hypothetical protein
MDTERDPTDQGIPDWDGLTPAQRRAACAPFRAEELQARRTPRRHTKRGRERAVRPLRKRWGPSRAPALLRPCEGCGATSGRWCSRAGREDVGFLHPSRTEGETGADQA